MAIIDQQTLPPQNAANHIYVHLSSRRAHPRQARAAPLALTDYVQQSGGLSPMPAYRLLCHNHTLYQFSGYEAT
jgi:hypothetical protein